MLHNWQSSGCTNATTCSVSLTGDGISTGSLLVISADSKTAGTMISSINVGGTYVSGNALSADSATWVDMGYVCPASATTGPVIVTFNQSNGGTQVNIREYQVPQGCPTLDAIYSVGAANSGTSVGGPALTLSGTSEIIVQQAATTATAGSNTHLTSIAGAYGANPTFANDETGAATADLLNTLSGSAPTWTAAASTFSSVAQAVAFGYGVTPCQNEALEDFSAGANGNTPALADLNSGLFGALGQLMYSSADSGYPKFGNSAPSYLSYSSVAFQQPIDPTRFCYGGATYAHSGASVGMALSSSVGSAESVLEWPLPLYQEMMTGLTAGVTFMTTDANNDTGGYCDTFDIWQTGSSGGPFVNASFEPNVGGTGALGFRVECCGTSWENEGLSIDYWTISNNTWYGISEELVPGGTSMVALYTISGGTYTVLLTHGGAAYINGTNALPSNPISYVSIGRQGGEGTMTSGYTNNWGAVRICYDMAWPCLP